MWIRGDFIKSCRNSVLLAEEMSLSVGRFMISAVMLSPVMGMEEYQ